MASLVVDDDPPVAEAVRPRASTGAAMLLTRGRQPEALCIVVVGVVIDVNDRVAEHTQFA